MLSNIRVTHSGLINLVTGLSRVATAFIFITFVTRSLSADEFGQYNLVLSMIAYVVMSHWFVSYWVTREIARGNSTGKTAILSSGIFPPVGFLIFLLIGISLDSNFELSMIALAGVLVPLQFLHSVLNNISIGWKPEAASYGNFLLEVTRVPLGFLFLLLLDMKLNGVFLSLIISYLVSIIVMLCYNRNQFLTSFSTSVFKNWLSRFWIPGYPALIAIISKLDFLIVTLLSSSTVVGFYAAAFAIGSLVSYANLVAVGVYPKLLGNDRGKYLSENFRLLIYFSIFFTAICVVFANQGLFVLNPMYQAVSISVIFISIHFLLFNIYNSFNSMLKATETIDKKQNPTVMEFIKSKLFKLPTIQLVQNVAYVLTLTVVLITVKFSSTVDMVNIWSAIYLITQIPSTLFLSYWIRKEKLISFNSIAVSKYLFAIIPTCIAVDFLNKTFLDYTDVFILIPQLVLILVISVLSYVAITFLIDVHTKKFVKALLALLIK